MAHKEIQATQKTSLGVLPLLRTSTAVTGAFWSLSRAHGALFIFISGAVGSAVTCAVIQGKTAGATAGSTATIAGKTTAFATTDTNTVKLIEVEASELDIANSYISVAAKITVAGAGACLGCAVVRKPLRYNPPAYVT